MNRSKNNAICFLVHSAENNVVSFCYRIWAGGTSFYIKLRGGTATGIKISAHGPDPRHKQPGFKFALDESAAATAHESSVWRFEQGAQMGWFPGAAIGDQAIHLARIRVPWSVMQRGAPSGPIPATSKSVGLHGKLAAPDTLRASDVDIYLSESGTPYWPNAAQVKRDNAGMGPLVNKASQHLTAVCTHRSIWRDETTKEHGELAKQFSGPPRRTIAVNRDDTGFLWIRELLTPESMLRQYSAEELDKAAGMRPDSGA